MFCTRCGAANSDDLMFCTNCSAQLQRPGETQKQPGALGTSQNPYPYTNPTSGPQQGSQGREPYPGFQSTYNPVESYQPYKSSYANQVNKPGAGASGRAIASLILSIVSIGTCGPFLSIPGAILGKMEMNAIRNGLAPKAGETLAKIGFYLGLGVTILYCLGIGLASFIFELSG